MRETTPMANHLNRFSSANLEMAIITILLEQILNFVHLVRMVFQWIASAQIHHHTSTISCIQPQEMAKYPCILHFRAHLKV